MRIALRLFVGVVICAITVWGGAASVYRYNEYTSETTLYDVAKNEVVWTGTIKTSEPESERTAIKSYVEAVMKALREKNSDSFA